MIAQERDALTFISGAEPGATLIYATAPTISNLSHRTISHVRRAYNDGLVDLCQRRLDGGFEYIAQMRRHRASVQSYGLFSNL